MYVDLIVISRRCWRSKIDNRTSTLSGGGHWRGIGVICRIGRGRDVGRVEGLLRYPLLVGGGRICCGIGGLVRGSVFSHEGIMIPFLECCTLLVVHVVC